MLNPTVSLLLAKSASFPVLTSKYNVLAQFDSQSLSVSRYILGETIWSPKHLSQQFFNPTVEKPSKDNCVYLSSYLRHHCDVASKTAEKASPKISKNHDCRVKLRPTAFSFRQEKQYATPFQLECAVKNVIRALQDAVNWSVNKSVGKGLDSDLKPAQKL